MKLVDIWLGFDSPLGVYEKCMKNHALFPGERITLREKDCFDLLKCHGIELSIKPFPNGHGSASTSIFVFSEYIRFLYLAHNPDTLYLDADVEIEDWDTFLNKTLAPIRNEDGLRIPMAERFQSTMQFNDGIMYNGDDTVFFHDFITHWIHETAQPLYSAFSYSATIHGQFCSIWNGQGFIHHRVHTRLGGTHEEQGTAGNLQ